MRLLWKAVRPAVFWTHRRGSWQYDLMVALILTFIFLAPRAWFRDQPQPQQIAMVSSQPEQAVFLVDPGLIRDPAPEQLEPQLRKLLEQRAHRRIADLRAEPALDSEGQLKGYLVHAKF